jgi:DNA excision repair protein ERCC-2
VDFKDVFPYSEFRSGQLELIQRVYDTCVKGGQLVIEAYNGFGKTICVLCGAIVAANNERLRVIYGCRTKRQIARVVEELIKIQKKTKIICSYISSKSDYCLLLHDENVSVPKALFNHYCNFKTTNNLCNYFSNFFFSQDHINKLVRSLSLNTIDYSALMKLATQEKFCPYELQKIILSCSVLTVSPYDYVLDETNFNMISDSNFSDTRTVVIFDEAHNLADYILDHHIVELGITEIEKASNEMSQMGFWELSETLWSFYKDIESYIENKNECKQDAQKLVEILSKGKGRLWLHEKVVQLTSPIQYSWFSVSLGKKIPESTYRCGLFFSKLASSKRPCMYFSSGRLYLSDLQEVSDFKKYINRFRAAIFASATLSPVKSFTEELGIEAKTNAYLVQTPDNIKCLTLIDTSVSTEFRKRNQENYNRIAEKIIALTEALTSSACIFTTSYSQLSEIVKYLQCKLRFPIYSEEHNMDAIKASELVNSFSKEQKALLLGIQGGRFAEGEDFAFTNTSMVVVLGFALPPPTPRLFLRYQRLRSQGITNPYFNCSVLPAVRKAVQAAGRGLRSLSSEKVKPQINAIMEFKPLEEV